jgi:hypothetical protein
MSEVSKILEVSKIPGVPEMSEVFYFDLTKILSNDFIQKLVETSVFLGNNSLENLSDEDSKIYVDFKFEMTIKNVKNFVVQKNSKEAEIRENEVSE